MNLNLNLLYASIFLCNANNFIISANVTVALDIHELKVILAKITPQNPNSATNT